MGFAEKLGSIKGMSIPPSLVTALETFDRAASELRTDARLSDAYKQQQIEALEGRLLEEFQTLEDAQVTAAVAAIRQEQARLTNLSKGLTEDGKPRTVTDADRLAEVVTGQRSIVALLAAQVRATLIAQADPATVRQAVLDTIAEGDGPAVALVSKLAQHRLHAIYADRSRNDQGAAQVELTVVGEAVRQHQQAHPTLAQKLDALQARETQATYQARQPFEAARQLLTGVTADQVRAAKRRIVAGDTVEA